MIYPALLYILVLPFQNCAPTSFESKKFSQIDGSSGSTESINTGDAAMAEKFASTLQPTLRANCSACHGNSQDPKFAVADSTTAVNTILQNNLVNLNDPANSRFVQKILSGHNGFPQSLAQEIQENVQAWSMSMGPSDAELPTVMLTSPTTNSVAAATLNLTAIASDNIGIAGVQFFVDGAASGAEDTASPYTITATLTSGTHSITARARDAAGNTKTSTAVSVTVSAPSPAAPTYATIYSTILSAKCTSCHSGTRADAGVRFDSYTNTVKTVVAGNAAGSKLYNVTKPGGSMPPGGSKLSSAQVQAIADWINAGALNN